MQVLKKNKRGGREGVAVAGTADGEEHRDALGLAVFDLGADAGQRVAREVDVVAARAEACGACVCTMACTSGRLL